MQNFIKRSISRRFLTIATSLSLAIFCGALLSLNFGRESVPWNNQDVGSPGIPGKVAYEGNRFILQGAGADIWGGADAFHFAYQVWNGDGEFIARLTSMTDTDPWAKAGIMLRSSLDQTSPHAMVAVTPRKGAAFIRRLQAGGPSQDDAHQAMRMVPSGAGVAFQQRGSAGADTARDAIVASTTPHWIKLVRQGNVVTALESRDGTEWLWLGTVQAELSGNLGLEIAFGATATAIVSAFDEGTWYHIEEQFTLKLQGAASGSISMGANYQDGAGCSAPGFEMLSLQSGAINGTLTASLKILYWNASFQTTKQFFPPIVLFP